MKTGEGEYPFIGLTSLANLLRNFPGVSSTPSPMSRYPVSQRLITVATNGLPLHIQQNKGGSCAYASPVTPLTADPASSPPSSAPSLPLAATTSISSATPHPSV